MKTSLEKFAGYSLASITTKNHPTVTACISIDLHESNSVRNQVLEQLYTDMLMSGCGKYSRDGFLDAVNQLGASLSLSISDGFFLLSLEARKDKFQKLMKLVVLMLTKPSFNKTELARAQKTAINELYLAREDSKTIAYSAMRNSMYGSADRRFSYPIEDRIKEVKRVKTAELKNFHKKIFTDTWVCSIAGDTSIVSEFKNSIKRVAPKNIVSATKAHTQNIAKQKLSLNHVSSKTNIDFSIGCPIPITLHHPDYVPLSFGISVLAKWGGFAGRLMSTVRELDGLTYSIYGRLETFSGIEQGYFRIMTFFAPDKAVQGLHSTFKQLSLLYKKGITETELTKFKTIIETQQTLLKDSVSSQLVDLHSYHQHGFDLNEMQEFKNKAMSLTVAEVNQVIKKYLNPTNLIISGAGPTQAVQKDIQKFVKNM